MLSLNIQQGQQFIRNHTHLKAAIDYQLNEPTPLVQKPFFAYKDMYIPFSACLLDNHLIYSAYDMFKQWNRNFSRDGFGKIFERYVEKTISYACNDYKTESEIKSWLPGGSKVVDFLIKEGNSTIIIDAKSTELYSIAQVFQSKESLKRNMDYIINGIVQIATTAHHLKCSVVHR